MVGGLVRIALVILAIAFVGRYFVRRTTEKTHMRVRTEAAVLDSLAPGDLRIYNADSTSISCSKATRSSRDCHR
jgi:hypothetical protein